MNRKLKAAMIERYGSQANFAMIVRRPEPIVSRVVNGRYQLPAEEERRWADLLDRRHGELFPGGDHELAEQR